MSEAVLSSPPPVSPVPTFDEQGFARELGDLGRHAQAMVSAEDLRHLKRLELAGRICTVLALPMALVWWPLAGFLFSHGLLTRWLLAHHICHGGYDRVPGAPLRYTSKGFAVGWRRFLDWFDWIHPDAWRYEHDFLHHYYTGEDADPDLVERNAALLRRLPLPRLLKYAVLFLVALTWKYSYYAANTLNALEVKKSGSKIGGHRNTIHLLNFFDLRQSVVRDLWFRCWAPYGLFHFVLLPALFLPLGTSAALAVLYARILGECLHNLHMFIVIVPNHAGDDLHRFGFHYHNRSSFFVNQVLGSVNYHCGTPFLDLSQMWLNYQIEHHLFPRLPMLAYRKIQPEVKAICARYGVPYVQENVFRRVQRLVAICVGSASMIQSQRPEQVQAALVA